MSRGLETIFSKARTAERRGDAAEARALYESILAQFPGNARAKRALEQIALRPDAAPSQAALDALVTLYQAGRFEQVVQAGGALRAHHAGSATLELLLGAAFAGLRRFPQAEEAFRRSIEAAPGNALAHFNLGVALQEQGRLDAAMQAYRAALAIQPGHADALFNIGTLLQALDRTADAIGAYREAVALAPGHLLAWYNLGFLLKDRGQAEEAVAAFDRALAIDAAHVPSLNNRGIALQRLSRQAEAIASYERALAIDPGHGDSWNNLGNALREAGRLDEAIQAFRRAIDTKPGFGEAFNNLGNAHRDRGDLEEAVTAYESALALMPGSASVLAQKLHQQAQMCDWTAFDGFAAVAAELGVTTDPVPPFTLLHFEDNPARQLARSRRWAERTYPALGSADRADPAPCERIRIGYFSADFHDHATLILMAGLFRAHDRARFSIHAYSYGHDDGGAMRQALIAHVDGFSDVRGLSDTAIAALARGHGLDIAIDLKGYTIRNRVGLFAHRPAPVQISFLGYPGSLGADFMDYIVADPVVLPDEARPFYSEKVITLPHSYQPNDDRRAIAATSTTRADHGLPEQGFVFCCFNNSYKLAPEEFGVWMRLLGKIPGSVLWLLRSNRQAEENLYREAVARGIGGDRLIFADRLPAPEHLARHRHADLFLDSFAYNAHTTASDALWAGLPMVTRAGRQFAARVGASLLSAAGLPELVTTTTEGYEALALALATDPERLTALRRRLIDGRMEVPLFDPALFACHIEAGYEAAHRRRLGGLPPDDIRIRAEG